MRSEVTSTLVGISKPNMIRNEERRRETGGLTDLSSQGMRGDDDSRELRALSRRMLGMACVGAHRFSAELGVQCERDGLVGSGGVDDGVAGGDGVISIPSGTSCLIS